MILFKKLKYKNLLSVGNTFIEIDLNRSPSTVITGRNGHGKSSILCALNFALFGRPYRNIKIPQLVNSVNQGGLCVELEFSVGKKEYLIKRGLYPAHFEIYENGKLIEQEANKRDYQAFLQDSILQGLNENVFKQVVVIGSANYRPFMQLPANQRREVIEELLDVKIFSQMLVIVKNNLANLKSILGDLDYNIEILKEKIKLNIQQLESNKKENKNKLKELDSLIEKEEEKISIKEKEIQEKAILLKDFKSKLLGWNPLKESIDQLTSLSNDLKKSQKKNTNTLNFYNQHSDCPTCGQHMDDDFKSKMIEETNETIQKVKEGIERVEVSLKKKLEFKTKFSKIQKNITEIENNIYQLKTDITGSNRLISKWKKEKNDILNIKNDSSSVDEFKKELEILKEKRKEHIESQDYYTVVAGMLKDGGIKSKIIKQYIPLMNKTINEYLTRLNLPVNFTLDENFNEQIKSRYRDVFQYANFSEGEKQRIDHAILLAWRYIAKSKNTINTNLLFLDEVFDSSLDADATDELLAILLEMTNTNLFIISHKQDLSDKLRSHIVFEKIGNFTTLKTGEGK